MDPQQFRFADARGFDRRTCFVSYALDIVDEPNGLALCAVESRVLVRAEPCAQVARLPNIDDSLVTICHDVYAGLGRCVTEETGTEADSERFVRFEKMKLNPVHGRPQG